MQFLTELDQQTGFLLNILDLMLLKLDTQLRLGCILNAHNLYYAYYFEFFIECVSFMRCHSN